MFVGDAAVVDDDDVWATMRVTTMMGAMRLVRVVMMILMAMGISDARDELMSLSQSLNSIMDVGVPNS